MFDLSASMILIYINEQQIGLFAYGKGKIACPWLASRRHQNKADRAKFRVIFGFLAKSS